MDLKGAKLTWLGHSTFRLETSGKTILIDQRLAATVVASRGCWAERAALRSAAAPR